MECVSFAPPQLSLVIASACFTPRSKNMQNFVNTILRTFVFKPCTSFLIYGQLVFIKSLIKCKSGNCYALIWSLKRSLHFSFTVEESAMYYTRVCCAFGRYLHG